MDENISLSFRILYFMFTQATENVNSKVFLEIEGSTRHPRTSVQTASKSVWRVLGSDMTCNPLRNVRASLAMCKSQAWS